MKILITTGIYPPEAGGPATYVQNLAKVLIEQGHQVGVITYSDQDKYDGDDSLSYKLIRVKRGNKLLNYINFFKAVNKNIKDFDLVYCFDHFSAGMPSVLASKLNKKKIAIRIGGDFIWERYVEKTGEEITLKEYYSQGKYKSDWRFKVIKLIFKLTDLLIFSTEFQRDIFQKYYSLKDKKIEIISNPIFKDKKIEMNTERNKEILWAGRMIKLKNLFNLIVSFSKIKNNQFKLILFGDGEIKRGLKEFLKEKDFQNIKIEDSISQEELDEKIKNCHAFVLPSYTDISPNIILNCIKYKTPFLISKENGFGFLKEKVLSFDPKNKEELESSLKKIIDSDFYKEYQNKISKIEYNYTFQEMTEDTLKLFKNTL